MRWFVRSAVTPRAAVPLVRRRADAAAERSAEKLIAMARQADASLQAEFGLPLGLVVIDTLGACTGFTKTGEESDTAVGQAIMDVLKAVSLALNCFALGVSHLGKDVSRGTRGASSREDAGDVVWACLGEQECRAASSTRG